MHRYGRGTGGGSRRGALPNAIAQCNPDRTQRLPPHRRTHRTVTAPRPQLVPPPPEAPAWPHLASPRLASPHLTSPHLASPRLASPRLASPIAAASPIATATAAPRQDQNALPQSQLDLSSMSTISSNLQPPAISSPSPPHSAPWPDLGPERESRCARVRVKGQG